MNDTATHDDLPRTQYALQLIGPSELTLNRSKPVDRPGPHQILARVEAVGLCFSDLKLLKQFSAHTRKGEVISGLPPEVLAEIPSYVPGDKPTVPGHEAVVRIVAAGEKVTRHTVGERCLVQTDYRTLRTAGRNASFGYNFEGALQEYVIMDERVIIDPNTGERFLFPVDEEASSAAIGLVEPWACIEDSYANPERRTIKPGGRLLVVAEAGWRVEGLAESFSPDGPPAAVTAVCAEAAQRQAVEALGLTAEFIDDAADLADQSADDIVYFGADKTALELLNDKLANNGILNVVLAGRTIGRDVSVGVGRMHYGCTRWIGTTESSAAESYGTIPPNGEIRPGERMLIVGAGGPMGQMHVIRALCAGLEGVSVVATDFDDGRLESLRSKTEAMAEAAGVDLQLVNPQNEPLTGEFTYVALMAPVGQLVARAIADSAPGCIVNIFAGIPAEVRHDLDLDKCIANRCFLYGTSGSVIGDMKIMLEKLNLGQIDTNCSVDAVSGMAGAADGIAAVENRTMAGKIVVYPSLHEMPLIPLSDLAERYPTVAAKLDNGQWCRAAEDELLRVAGD